MTPGGDVIPGGPRLTTRLAVAPPAGRRRESRALPGARRIQAAEALEAWGSTEYVCLVGGGVPYAMTAIAGLPMVHDVPTQQRSDALRARGDEPPPTMQRRASLARAGQG